MKSSYLAAGVTLALLASPVAVSAAFHPEAGASGRHAIQLAAAKREACGANQHWNSKQGKCVTNAPRYRGYRAGPPPAQKGATMQYSAPAPETPPSWVSKCMQGKAGC